MLMSLLLASVSWDLSALAEAPPPTVYNPKPAEGDLILPMPGDAEMVFRRVRVPGSGFWGDQSRIIQIGDAAGGIFEGLQRTQISGSFPVEKEDAWEIMLAKYELTRGQYVAVMGMDALMAASGDPEDQKLPTLEGRALRDALMRPLTYVSHGRCWSSSAVTTSGSSTRPTRKGSQPCLGWTAHPDSCACPPRMNGSTALAAGQAPSRRDFQ